MSADNILSPHNAAALSADDINDTAKKLAAFEPGFLPLPLFNEITRLTVTPIIEIVPIHRSVNGLEILLLKRQVDDPLWPSYWHTPGTVIRATDTFQTAITRLTDDELGGLKLEPVYVGHILHHSGRGMEAAQIYWLDLTGSAIPKGTLYGLEELPVDMIQSQHDFIPMAVEHFNSQLTAV
jgi:hypothetical protein